MELQKRTATDLQITPGNWQQTWPLIPVNATTSPAVITASKTPALSQMGRDNNGVMVGVSVFKIMTAALAAFMDGKWTTMQVDEAAQVAYDEYYWFTLAEFKQFLSRVKVGFYTSNKNFTPPVFMEFLQLYAAERLDVRYNHYSQQAIKKKTILPIKKLVRPEDYHRCKLRCDAIGAWTERCLAEITQKIKTIAAGMSVPVHETTDEKEYQQIKADYNTASMQWRRQNGLDKLPLDLTK